MTTSGKTLKPNTSVKSALGRLASNQLFIPILALILLSLFVLIAKPSFFNIEFKNVA